MEFHVDLAGVAADPGLIEEALQAVDPAAIVDIDPSTAILRVATLVDARELVAAIAQAGYHVDPAQVRQLPSICCGGCSG